MRIRIKFRKYGVMRFIGHLDIMRYFQKAMRRANIDIAYSEGFSPHQIMSFAAPLGVGITSDGEYLDIEVHSTKSTDESRDALNAVMVDGIEITEYVVLRQDAKKAMTSVAAADYIVYFKNQVDFTQEELGKITEAFYMVDKSRSRQEGGAGLGLALCVKIAEVHGGRLDITSQLGTGTKVRVIFDKKR